MQNKGSVTVETAIIFPVVMIVLILGSAIITLCLDYIKIRESLNGTAVYMSDYAYIYHEKIISKFMEKFEDKAYSELEEGVDQLMSAVPDKICEVINIKEYMKEYGESIIDSAESQVYMPIAKGIFMSFYMDKSVSGRLEYLDFSESSFFEKDNTILLDLKFGLKVPLIFEKFSVDMRCRIRVNTWVSGVGEDTEEEDIWEMSNFERGRKLRSIMGANLPENFPVIAIFKDGRASMIKSIDYRKKTYLKEGALYTSIKGMIDRLKGYYGTEIPFGKENIVIKREDISIRELILVIPRGEESAFAAEQLEKARKYALSRMVILTVKKY